MPKFVNHNIHGSINNRNRTKEIRRDSSKNSNPLNDISGIARTSGKNPRPCHGCARSNAAKLITTNGTIIIKNNHRLNRLLCLSSTGFKVAYITTREARIRLIICSVDILGEPPGKLKFGNIGIRGSILPYLHRFLEQGVDLIARGVIRGARIEVVLDSIGAIPFERLAPSRVDGQEVIGLRY